MIRRAALLLVLAGCGSPPAATPATETVHFVGRFDRTDPTAPKFEWPGSTMRTRFSGTEIAVTLTDTENQYQVIVDGQPTHVVKTKPGKGTYVVATGLAEGEHDIVLYKRTEALFKTAQFHGFVPKPPGKLIGVTYPKARTIEIIGDSISCGYGNEGANATCRFSADTENAYLAYGALTARALGADHTIIAWSGKGLSRNYNNNESWEKFAAVYERTLPTHTDSVWAFSGPEPDVAIINLGTNDFSLGDPGAAYEAAYTQFLMRLRERYKKTFVFCTVGPVDKPEHLPQARAHIEAVIAAANARGDTRVQYVEIPIPDRSKDGLGCDYHPSLVTHRAMAELLTAAIRRQMDW